jgi:hypothetical protein
MTDPISHGSLLLLICLAAAAFLMGLVVFSLTVSRASRADGEVEAYRDEIEKHRSSHRHAA